MTALATTDTMPPDRVLTRPIIDDPNVDVAALERALWRHVTRTKTCWLWGGAKKGRGYGHIRLGGHWFTVHRVSYEIAFGPIPPRMRVLHRCDTPACVNPGHLFLGTAKDNTDDARAKGRLRSPGL